MLPGCWLYNAIISNDYLVFVNFPILQLCFSLFLEGDDDQGHKYVDKKEWKYDEEDNVEDWHLCSE